MHSLISFHLDLRSFAQKAKGTSYERSVNPPLLVPIAIYLICGTASTPLKLWGSDRLTRYDQLIEPHCRRWAGCGSRGAAKVRLQQNLHQGISGV
jgi:hypothetical protein